MRVWWAAGPLAWAALLMLHPAPDPDDMYGSLRDEPGRWLIVHVGTLFFIGLVGATVLRLVAGLPGPAAIISRVAALVFMVFYGAGDSINGIAVGVLVRHANTVPEEDRDAVARAIQALMDDFLSDDLAVTIGAIGWAVAVLAAAAAVWQAGAHPAVPILLVVSSVVLMHAPPIGPIGLVCFAAAIVVWARVRSAPPTPARSLRRR